jgi:LPS-assembly lipoprotein
MLSSESYRQRLVRFSVVVLVATLVGACGFRPLYGRHGAGTLPAEQYLARIEIKQIDSRIGQQLRNNLLSRLSPKGSSGQPLYSLSINISESISSLGVKKSAVVTRGNLRVSAQYTMVKLHFNEENTDPTGVDLTTSLTNGTVLATSSYDIPQAQYAALAALKDARTRAVKELADDIRTRLAVYFKQNPESL